MNLELGKKDKAREEIKDSSLVFGLKSSGWHCQGSLGRKGLGQGCVVWDVLSLKCPKGTC